MIVVAVGGAVAWVARTLLTNKAEIDALKGEIEDRQNQRARDSETVAKAIDRLHQRIDELDSDIKQLLRDRADDLKQMR